MRVTCSSCSANYTIADDKVRNKRVKLRCKKCGTTIVVEGLAANASSQPSAVATSEAPERNAASLQPADSSPTDETWMVNLSDEDEREMTLEQIAAGFRDGAVTADAFVWKDGMGDWVPVLDVTELKDAIDAVKAVSKIAKSSPPRANVSPVTSGAVGKLPTRAGAAIPGVGVKKSTLNIGSASKPLAIGDKGGAGKRAATAKTSAVADLFGAVAKAGSEEDVTTSSAPEPPSPKQPTTGTRNENSVLFSLDSLKAGFQASGAPPKQQTAQPKRSSFDDIMAMSGPTSPAGFMSLGVSDLLTAPAPPPPPEPKKEVPTKFVAAADTASFAPAPADGKRKLIIAAIAVMGLLGVGGLVLGATSGNDEEAARVAELEAKLKEQGAKLKAEKKASAEAQAIAEQTAKEKEEAERKAAEAKKEAKAAAEQSAEDAKDDSSGKVASTGHSRGVSAPSTGSKDSKKDQASAEKTDTKKPGPAAVTVSSNPSSGVSTFDKGAARSALSVAASGAAGCKKAGGPTGSGRVMVTFAPSGRVTSANVVGAPFAGTPVGGCVATIFRRASVPQFSGASVTVAKSFQIQ